MKFEEMDELLAELQDTSRECSDRVKKLQLLRTLCKALSSGRFTSPQTSIVSWFAGQQIHEMPVVIG